MGTRQAGGWGGRLPWVQWLDRRSRLVALGVVAVAVVAAAAIAQLLFDGRWDASIGFVAFGVSVAYLIGRERRGVDGE